MSISRKFFSKLEQISHKPEKTKPNSPRLHSSNVCGCFGEHSYKWLSAVSLKLRKKETLIYDPELHFKNVMSAGIQVPHTHMHAHKHRHHSHTYLQIQPYATSIYTHLPYTHITYDIYIYTHHTYIHIHTHEHTYSENIPWYRCSRNI